ncbi:MAG: hypothetical protein KatS3mg102_0022 [Planctomycetota bacterium]|nr:MAG: hypothetical protein KatS3mg102_0022 [Planctomycetota bacterium]
MAPGPGRRGRARAGELGWAGPAGRRLAAALSPPAALRSARPWLAARGPSDATARSRRCGRSRHGRLGSRAGHGGAALPGPAAAGWLARGRGPGGARLLAGPAGRHGPSRIPLRSTAPAPAVAVPRPAAVRAACPPRRLRAGGGARARGRSRQPGHAVRPLPDPRGAGPRRHGGRLQGVSPRAAARVRAEDAERAARHPGGRGAVRAGGPRGGQAPQAPQHRPDLRRGADPRHALHRDGVRAGRAAGRDGAAPRAPAGRGAAGDRPQDRARARPRAPAGHRAPRHEAGQRRDRPGRRAADPRFRAGEGHRTGRDLARQRDRGHPGLHAARAGRSEPGPGRPPHRRVCARRHAVSRRVRQGAVRGGFHGRDLRQDHVRGAAAAPPGGAGLPRLRRHRRPGDGEAAARPLPDRARAGG